MLTLLSCYRQTIGGKKTAGPPPAPPLRQVDSFGEGAYPLCDWTVDEDSPAGWVDKVAALSAAERIAWRDDDVLVLHGWSGEPTRFIVIKTVLFSVGSTVVGAADVRHARADVASAIHPNLLISGWQAELLVGHLVEHAAKIGNGALRAWAVMPDSAVLRPLLFSCGAIRIPKRNPAISLGGFHGRAAVTPPLLRNVNSC